MTKATHTGKLNIGDKTIPCAVLEDGTRLLTETGVLRALGRSHRPSGAQAKGRDQLPSFLQAKNLNPFISQDLLEETKPIKFTPIQGGRSAFGYKAELLPKICDVFLDARTEKKLASHQEHIADQCEVLIRGLARVGIIALVDEATGYQEVRDRLALQKILEKYLTDEWAKWTKTFPDEYYRELFKLKGMPYPPTSSKRPSYIGHWTNDIVYSRLIPKVLTELKKKNPRLPSGQRKRKFHQYLTRDIGHPALKEHLSNVIFLMRSCTKWDDFKRRLNRAKPKYGDTMPLDFPESD